MAGNDAPTALPRAGTNAVGRMLGLLGDEWTLLIMQQATLGARRYSEFVARLPISNSVLSARLQALTDEALLSGHVYQTNPLRAEYQLTARGRGLWPVLLSIWEWERRWVAKHATDLPNMHHEMCGRDFAPIICCGSCGESATAKDVLAQWGPSGSWRRSAPTAATRRRSGRQSEQAGLFPETMSIFGNRWSAALLVGAFLGTARFTDFRAVLGAPPSVIAERLHSLAASGVLTGGPRYQLTEKGRAFFPVLVLSLQWAQRWFRAPEGPAVLLSHEACGDEFVGTLACDQCAELLIGGGVRVGDFPAGAA
jgi:DNA-binding HxlR family transcriptional regulator